MSTLKRKAEIHEYLATAPCDRRLEVRIPKELLKAAQRYARLHNQPLSYVVKFALATTVGE